MLPSFQDDSASMAGSMRSAVSRSSKGSSRTSKTSRRPKGSKPTIKEPPKKPHCTSETIHAGLSQLGRTADGLRPAFLKLQVEGTDLATADPVAPYCHLQTLLLCNNELSSLKALGSLDSLTHLDVSGNKLTNVLGYKASTAHDVILRHADFSSNLISSIDNLADFTRLLTLRLDKNEIERICGLRQLHMLQRLSISGNKLLSCLGLQELCALQELDLTDNQLVNLEPLAALHSLEVLLVGRNRLQRLQGLEELRCLRKLDVRSNQLANLQELSYMSSAAHLSDLQTNDNPWDKFMSVRLHIVNLLPQVTILNAAPVSAKEKVLSINMHGADAEGLRAIRHKFFPNGELDDGGGAIPPAAAGLAPCQAEEERADGLDAEFLRIDAWAKSLGPGADTPWWHAARAAAAMLVRSNPLLPTTSNLSKLAMLSEEVSSVVAGGVEAAAAVVPLVTLADQLASTCGGAQVLLARACWQWVSQHTSPPRKELTWSVHVPLFGEGPQRATAELALLGAPRPPAPAAAGAEAGSSGATAADADSADAAGGAWAERAAWLFVQLARACELEAVMIPGYWKNGVLEPGSRIEAHNHCWAGVKVNGRWRLIDCTAAALQGGGAPAAAFFIPPEAFIFSYLPLAAVWQLLDAPISLETWWAMPECSIAFFTRGCKLLTQELRSVNVLPSFREGEVLPHLQLTVASPQQPGRYLSHTVYDASSRKVVACWPPADPGRAQLAYQQVTYGDGSAPIVEFGHRSFVTQATQLFASFPGPGEYFLEVQNIFEVPGGLPVHVEELGTTLALRIVQSDDVLRIKVVVPEPEPYDPEDGILHDASNPLCLMPYTHDRFTTGRCQLVSPSPSWQLEADQQDVLEVVAPGATRLALAAPDGTTIAELQQVESEEGEALVPARFRLQLHVPRVDSLKVLAYMHRADLGVCGWEPLLTLQVLPQSQHIVELVEDYDVPEVAEDDPAAAQALEMFTAMDRNKDGRVTRREMLVAFRHNRQHADHLKIPARIHLHDGTFDRFVERFLAIDWSKLGSFTFSELCLYMGITPTEYSDGESGSYLDSDQELDEAEGEAEGEGFESEGQEGEGEGVHSP